MLSAKGHRNFTASGDVEAEKLLERVLCEMQEKLSGTGLSVLLGGSYGRGDGGVRMDRENGILYNDLDFFVFAREKNDHADALLKEISKKYEHELKVEVDFSRTMTIKDIQANAPRLMMQELKRGYFTVCGEDLLEKYLPEIPPELLPFSEACRLFLNRGMGLLLAGEKIAENSQDADFILRNLYKAIIGTGDAILISHGTYRWKITERLKRFQHTRLPDSWKELYHEAVNFKCAPHREMKPDMIQFWHTVRDFYRAGMLHCAEAENDSVLLAHLARKSRQNGEKSLFNYIKYCIKSRSLALNNFGKYSLPAVTWILPELYTELEKLPAPESLKQSKLYQHWLIFN